MARARGRLQRFNFSRGWNTEAGATTFPENSATDLDNVIIDIDGSMRRRPGIITDSDTITFGTAPSVPTTEAYSFHSWTNVAGTGTLAFTVTQIGTDLYFHAQRGTDTLDTYLGTIDFSSYVISGQTGNAAKGIVQVANGLGYIFVTGEFINPFYVAYDLTEKTFSATEINIEIRDFKGLDDGLAVDERPTTLSGEHAYNLRNQGWLDSFDCAVNGSSKATTDPVEYTKNNIGAYPSNADILYLGKAGSGTDEDDIGRYDPKTMAKNTFGTTPAPKGKFIVDAFNIVREVTVGALDYTFTDVTDRRPQTAAFHNGRVFFAGVNATGKVGNVYYSQQLTDVDNVGKCYQQNDPTAEEFNELLATDGGLLVIPGAGRILKLLENDQGVAVFAANGVWQITGENGRFSADNLFVTKVTDIGCIGPETVVGVESNMMYWSNEGIIALAGDQVTGNLKAQNITKNTIDSAYLLIGGIQQQLARGAYMAEEKKVVWIYSTSTSYDGTNNRFKYNGVLVFDLQLQAFYRYTISDIESANNTPRVAGIIKQSVYSTNVVDAPVTVNGETVTENGATVTAGSEVDVGTSVEVAAWKMLVILPTTSGKCTMAEFRGTRFADWENFDAIGVDFSSYAETGFENGGDPRIEKQPTYISTYLSKDSKTFLQNSYFYSVIGGGYQYGSRICGDLSTTEPTSTFTPVRPTALLPPALSNPDPTDWSTASITSGHFNSDGTKLFVVWSEADAIWLGNEAAAVSEYDLTTPYDITTCSPTPNGHTYLVTYLNSDLKLGALHSNNTDLVSYNNDKSSVVWFDVLYEEEGTNVVALDPAKFDTRVTEVLATGTGMGGGFPTLNSMRFYDSGTKGMNIGYNGTSTNSIVFHDTEVPYGNWNASTHSPNAPFDGRDAVDALWSDNGMKFWVLTDTVLYEYEIPYLYDRFDYTKLVYTERSADLSALGTAKFMIPSPDWTVFWICNGTTFQGYTTQCDYLPPEGV